MHHTTALAFRSASPLLRRPIPSAVKSFAITSSIPTSATSRIVLNQSASRRPASSPSPPPMFNFFRSFFSSPSSQDVAMASQKAQKLIDENPVMVFSKSWCPYCKATKSLLSSLDVDFKTVELDQESDGAAIQDALEGISGQRSVPNIYISKKHIGGNSDIQSLNNSGKLKSLLAEAGAITA
ncbi:hypothetical protein NQ176_g11013 [Zarea fungicola]|uniref:Uncharacterized protein n=1 Tax=Zarea fungicola TaxID=93591 RepID=A0ACC1MCG9_9HYPO|nr:hypothetical protein NQ176_g11013 [Lecanicillium fungicola]